MSISYPASRAFQTDLADPVPCLDTHSGVVYSSNTPVGRDQRLRFDRQPVSAPGVQPDRRRASTRRASPPRSSGGWRPIGIRPDCTTFIAHAQRPPSAPAHTSTSRRAEIGQVAAIELPPDANLTDVSMSMNVWGYGDASLQGAPTCTTSRPRPPIRSPGERLPRDSQSADSTSSRTSRSSACSSRSGRSGSARRHDAAEPTGNVSTPAPLTGQVVMTDLLPFGLSWHNPSTSADFSVTKASGGTAATVTGTVARYPQLRQHRP